MKMSIAYKEKKYENGYSLGILAKIGRKLMEKGELQVRYLVVSYMYFFV